MAYVEVDGERCQGHGRCFDVCPEIFEEDALGFSVVTKPEVDETLVTKALDAERLCPERAIAVRIAKHA